MAQTAPNMTFTLSNVAMREWFHRTRESVKPWGAFVSTQRFKLPKHVAPLGKRIIKNIEHFQGNYLFVFLGLVIFCVLTSPLLLIAIAACLGACYIISLKNQENKYKIMGHEISLAQQYTAVGILSFPLFWVAGAGSAVFWIIGASFFLISVHASLYSIEEENDFAELTMENV